MHMNMHILAQGRLRSCVQLPALPCSRTSANLHGRSRPLTSLRCITGIRRPSPHGASSSGAAQVRPGLPSLFRNSLLRFPKPAPSVSLATSAHNEPRCSHETIRAILPAVILPVPSVELQARGLTPAQERGEGRPGVPGSVMGVKEGALQQVKSSISLSG